MSDVFFISDLHLGHKKILNFSGSYRQTTQEEHDQWIIDQINSVVTKRDQLWILGDVAMNDQALDMLSMINTKPFNRVMVRGNHDLMNISKYLKHFRKIHGIVKYKKFWVSHCPIHPLELRGVPNIHGHVHQNSIPDDRYFNVCVEMSNGVPVSLDEIKEKYNGLL